MKLFLAATALAVASPAMAQTAAEPRSADQGIVQTPAAADPSCPPEHAAMGHCTPRAAAAQPAPAMKADGKMPCCDKAKAEAKKPCCCDEMGGKAAGAHADHQGN